MAFRRARLCSDSGVVEAKYERNDVPLRLEAYDDARSVIICLDRDVRMKRFQFICTFRSPKFGYSVVSKVR